MHMGSLREAEEKIGSASNVRQLRRHVIAHAKFERGGRENLECVQCAATFKSCRSIGGGTSRRGGGGEPRVLCPTRYVAEIIVLMTVSLGGRGGN